MKELKAVYAGSFDLITNGHSYMIAQTMALFPKAIFAVAINPAKKYMFSDQERHEMVERTVGDCLRLQVVGRILNGTEYNYETAFIENRFLVDFAREEGATHLIRGMRNSADFEFERAMRNINRDREPTIETIFLMPPRELAEVSSSMVKTLLGLQGWPDLARQYVPKPMMDALEKKLVL